MNFHKVLCIGIIYDLEQNQIPRFFAADIWTSAQRPLDPLAHCLKVACACAICRAKGTATRISQLAQVIGTWTPPSRQGCLIASAPVVYPWLQEAPTLSVPQIPWQGWHGYLWCQAWGMRREHREQHKNLGAKFLSTSVDPTEIVLSSAQHSCLPSHRPKRPELTESNWDTLTIGALVRRLLLTILET